MTGLCSWRRRRPAVQTPEQVAQACQEGLDLFRPVIDTATGIKTLMVRDGWSETAAEQVAAVWIANTITVAAGHAIRS